MTESLDNQAIHLETVMGTLIRRIYSIDHAATNLPVAQLRICSILLAGPRSITSLSEELGMTASAITQIADRLENSGYISRSVEKEDRRVKLLKLTGKGREKMRSRRNIRIRRLKTLLERMNDMERCALMDALVMLSNIVVNNAAATPHGEATEWTVAI